MADVRLHNVTKLYSKHTVIEKLCLDIKHGEFLTLLGPSGCGKTTLLRMIAGLEEIDGGELLIDGKNYTNVPAQHRKIAMVFQSYALFPHMTVRSNILFGLRIQNQSRALMEEKLDWAMSMLHLCGLENRLPREISGGQRQRVALARALVLDPEVLLLDEPLSNLDAALRETATDELKRIHRQVGKTIIYVTHNQVEAMTMSGRIALLNAGRLEQFGEPRIVYDHPKSVFAAKFIGSPAMNFFNGVIAEQGESVGIATDLGFLLLDKDRSTLVRAMIGKEVTVGIRPQNVSYTEHRAARRFTDTCLEVTVELIETMGDRSLIVGKSDRGIILRFLITREANLVLDQKVKVFIDGRRLHLFDADNQMNIFQAHNFY
ncbi:MAG: ATP-binding cassette domain-containing protein [Chitinivibrionales bacterium]|nr:ATP-binding cassette domain-containing protein [Chitinivibrionales bacterium]